MKNIIGLLILVVMVLACGETKKQMKNAEAMAPTKLKALIVDGQNNHYIWPKSTQMMKDYMEETGLFTVDIHRSDSVWLGIKYNQDRPEPYRKFIEDYPVGNADYAISDEPIQHSAAVLDFEAYDVIVSNLGSDAALWPEKTRNSFEQYLKNGGGFVVVHAANNAWGNWKAYNDIIGLGAWGGRNESNGPYVYYNDAGVQVSDSTAGVCGSHGPEYEFKITTRAPEHPIMMGIPKQWLHTQDELYERMRGPFENATILATAFADIEKNAPPWDLSVKGLGQHVPMLMTINYGKGRVFHTTLGHFDYSMECVGFITTLQRGVEWAATGTVTQVIPKDFPTKTTTSSRDWQR